MATKFKYTTTPAEGGLLRITAARSFGSVRKGDVGGFIQSESNLSHKGKCWIANGAKVHESSEISGNAQVYGKSEVKGTTKLRGNASLRNNVLIT